MARPSREFLLDPRDQALVAVALLGEALGDGRVRLRVDDAEGQFLELLAHVLHAHAPGERRVDLERFLGVPLARLLGHELEGPHVVQPVRELDEEDADILGDGEEELPEVLGLRRLLRHQIQLLDLGQPLDQPADILAEGRVDLGAGRVGVLDRVVEERCGDRRIVELEVGEDCRHFERMREIGIAVGAPLRAMLLHGVDIGLVEQVLVRVRVVARHPLDKLVLAHHGARSNSCSGRLIGRNPLNRI